MIIDRSRFSANYHSFYYDKRLNDFGRKERKNVKITICVDDKSQIIILYDVYFEDIHDSKEFKKILKSMDIEIVSKFKIIIDIKGYDLEENHVIAKKT